MIDPTARVHETADLEADVIVGPSTSIWNRAQVREGARIGAECTIGRDAFIDAGVVLGDRVKVQNGALVYHGVSIDDGVFVGPGAILTNDRTPRAITTTGDLVGPDDWTVSPIRVERGASVGAGAVVVAGVTIGAFAMVGAGAVVTKDVTPNALVAGNPAHRIGWVCDCGTRLETADGAPVPAEPDRYSRHPELVCPKCERRYRYVHDEDRLESLADAGPPQGQPA